VAVVGRDALGRASDTALGSRVARVDAGRRRPHSDARSGGRGADADGDAVADANKLTGCW